MTSYQTNLQVIVLATAMSVSFMHGSVLENKTQYLVMFYLYSLYHNNSYNCTTVGQEYK